MRFLLALFWAFTAWASGDERHPQRVISLAPSVTETIFALGLQDRLVARTRFCDYPADAPPIEVLPDMVQPSAEHLLTLRPDLILASDPTPAAAIEQLVRLRIPALRLTTSGLESVLMNLQRIGTELGDQAAGRALESRIRQELSAVDRKISQVPQGERPRAVLFYGTDTEFCAGPGSFAGEILERAGGRNVAEDVEGAWPRLNRERLLVWNPETILIALTADPGDLNAAQKLASSWRRDPVWQRLDAVRSGRIVFVTGSLLMIPGPRAGAATRALAQVFHPALFPETASPEVHEFQPDES